MDCLKIIKKNANKHLLKAIMTIRKLFIKYYLNENEYYNIR